MASPMLAPCMVCKNLQDIELVGTEGTNGSNDMPDQSFDFTCNAYPNGIPSNILTWDRSHITVLLDQEGEFVYSPDLVAVRDNPGAVARISGGI